MSEIEIIRKMNDRSLARYIEWVVCDYLPKRNIDIQFDEKQLKGLKLSDRAEQLMDLVMDYEKDNLDDEEKAISLLIAVEAQSLKLDEYRQLIYFFIRQVSYIVVFKTAKEGDVDDKAGMSMDELMDGLEAFS